MTRKPRQTTPVDPPETDAADENDTTRLAVMAVALVVGVLLLYGRVQSYGFTDFDDGAYVHEHTIVRQGLTLEGWNYAWRIEHSGDGGHESFPHAANWHPLTTLSHMLDCEMFDDPARPHGQWGGGHHMVNVLLHAANAVMLMLAFWRMTRAFWPSAAVAAMFALHPMHVESVAWVSERKDVLSGLFWMLGLLAYARYAEAPSVGRYLLVAGSLTLGLLAKPMVITLPLVFCLLDAWPLRRWARLHGKKLAAGDARRYPSYSARQLIVEKLPLAAIMVAAAAMTMFAQGQRSAVVTWEALPLDCRLANALVSCAGYLRRLVLPTNLSCFYPHPLMPVPDRFSEIAQQAVGAGALLIALSAAIYYFGRTRQYLFTGWLWFLITLLPVIGLIQVGSQAMADRYAYLPYIGLYVILAFAGRDLVIARPGLRPLVVGVGLLTLIGWWVAASFQVDVWKNNRTLFEHALSVNERNFVAQFRIAEEYERDALAASGAHRQQLLQEAARHFEAGLAIDGRDASKRLKLGNVYLNLQALLPPQLEPVRRNLAEAALQQFSEAEPLMPDDPRLPLGRADAFQALGNLPQAIQAYQRAIDVDPNFYMSYNGLASVYAMQNNFTAAAALLEKVIQLNPGYDRGHYNLGQVRERMGQLAEAEKHYLRALEINPRYTKAAEGMARVQQALKK